MLLGWFFVFNYPATTEIYTYCHTLSLHDALPIYPLARLGLWPQRRFGMPAGIEQHQHGADAMTVRHRQEGVDARQEGRRVVQPQQVVQIDPDAVQDRKSTRLNSSH